MNYFYVGALIFMLSLNSCQTNSVRELGELEAIETKTVFAKANSKALFLCPNFYSSQRNRLYLKEFDRLISNRDLKALELAIEYQNLVDELVKQQENTNNSNPDTFSSTNAASLDTESTYLHNLVKICSSNSAKRYHKNTCEGLNKCKGKIKQVKIADAIEDGITPCGYCFPRY